jgi:probable F420-dependent oxidoreductase
MAIGVGLGLAAFPFSTAAGYWQWVRLCDEEGVDSLWQTDRLVSREPFLECMSTMAALAGATKRIKFGMNVASLGLRDPLQTAKQCATIDFLSGGRLLPAFGLGSNRSRDWEASGRPTKARGQRMNEALELLSRLWSEDEVSHQGTHFSYDRVSIMPKPVQAPLPLWIGGGSDAAVERTARYGTGWQAAFESPEEAGRVVAAIHEAADKLGRAIDRDHMGTAFGVRFGSWEDPAVARAASDFETRTGRSASDAFAVGGADEVLERIARYAEQGVAKFILRPLGVGDGEMMAQTERIIAEVMPEVAKLKRKG